MKWMIIGLILIIVDCHIDGDQYIDINMANEYKPD